MNDTLQKQYAVIFDMDGTLYDTEKVYREAWLNAGVSLELYQTFIGTAHTYIVETLAAHGMDPDEVIGRKAAYVNETLEKGIPLKPGALECLKWLREQGWPCAIATSSSMATADRYLDVTDMRQYFTKVVSGNRLEHGKPEPDIFFMAAEELKEAPENCIVIEDSFNGVRAGHAAGMYTVMVPDLVAPDEEILGLADAVLPSLSELPALLASL